MIMPCEATQEGGLLLHLTLTRGRLAMLHGTAGLRSRAALRSTLYEACLPRFLPLHIKLIDHTAVHEHFA